MSSFKAYKSLCFPTSNEERRLSVFENRVLRRMFGLNRDEVTGKWKKTT